MPRVWYSDDLDRVLIERPDGSAWILTRDQVTEFLLVLSDAQDECDR